MLTLVIDGTDRPALYGAAAARLAYRDGARFMHLPARFDLARDPDAAQYVHASGGLGPSGLFFAERSLGKTVEPALDLAAIIAAAREENVVVPVHPRFGQSAEAVAEPAREAGVSVLVVDVPVVDDCLGRGQATAGSDVSILLVGRERDHRDVYPAALVSLQDAASQLGLSLAVRFGEPAGLVGPGADDILAAADGILLPGGSSMCNVPAQIAASRHALENDIPVLGLCLGMQTMATAFAQRALATEAVNLAEADPDAPIKSFVAMAALGGEASLPIHRTGNAVGQARSGTKLASLIAGEPIRFRYNHRYCLAPGLHAKLQEAGLVISLASHDDRVVDGIEVPRHPFFWGFQGHPELGFPAGRPHPVFMAFLSAARERAQLSHSTTTEQN
ncbi:Glutamine amidotransferase class-I [Faunimonas pinastri]|uniref:CTP synthase (glutamine hydrolyzing) n=1 Tax=Faunimonas pinastri TaxID=1855383 RepID=A0A1H9ERT0_9HYPH|nr:gamma-glutamyl-gamma-aminobutyrate hydrolase family protein [Faunimonas pinastri]SEQ28404.1 Glutamine amidotransferase class-I [Faunimonas pinastri]